MKEDFDREQELKDDIVIWLWLLIMFGLLWLLNGGLPDLPI